MSLGLGKVLTRQSLGQGGPAMGHPYAGATHRLSVQRPIRLLAALDRLAQQPREGLTWTLTPSQRAPLRRALEAVPYDPLGGQAYVQAVRAVMQRCLPKAWLQSLADQALSASARTFIAMQDAPLTPVAANAQAKPDHLTENLVVGVAALVGAPYSIAHEGSGVVNDVRPQPECAHVHTSQGFLAPLELHTEHPALKHARGGVNLAPIGIVLTGVRDDATGRPPTQVADAVAALCALSQRDLEALMQPAFRFKSPQRWAASAGASYDTRGPVLFQNQQGAPELAAAFFPGCVTAETDAGRVAYAKLGQQLQKHSQSVAITPGTVVYVDNRLALHGRVAIVEKSLVQPGYVPQRWLQRTCVAANDAQLARFTPHHGRVVIPPATQRDRSGCAQASEP